MIIKLRHITEGDPVDFTEGDLDTLDDLIQLFDAHGVYYDKTGNVEACGGFQFVLGEKEAFAEILIGDASVWN